MCPQGSAHYRQQDLGYLTQPIGIRQRKAFRVRKN
jgi:hypothetical protein